MSVEEWKKIMYPEDNDFKSALNISKVMSEIGGDTQIHIIVYYKKAYPGFDRPPFTFNNTIKIILDNSISQSPIVQKDGSFVILDGGLLNPSFVNKLIGNINSMKCH